MGTYRLFLATLVLISHLGISVGGYNPGVFAVVSFFIISGFVTTILIEKNYFSFGKITSFYKDRALRIYPQFLFYFIASSLVIRFLLPDSPYAHALKFKHVIAALAVLPLGLSSLGFPRDAILPPAWSLGLEMFFYMVIPFILILRARPLLFGVSIIVFGFACLGFINADIWGYRLLPGTLFIFLCGSYLHSTNSFSARILVATFAAAVLAFVGINNGAIERVPFNAEITAGITFGIPAVWLLSKIKSNKLDMFFGNISYGLFLNHFVVIYLAEAYNYDVKNTLGVLSVFAISFVSSVATFYLIERPVLRIRHAIRSRSRLSKAAVPAVA